MDLGDKSPDYRDKPEFGVVYQTKSGEVGVSRTFLFWYNYYWLLLQVNY